MSVPDTDHLECAECNGCKLDDSTPSLASAIHQFLYAMAWLAIFLVLYAYFDVSFEFIAFAAFAVIMADTSSIWRAIVRGGSS